MKNIENILNEDQIEKYQKDWKRFSHKNKVNSGKNTHSGLPVISKIYRFENTQIFRAHVFPNKLRKFDPYFMTDKYSQPFWHGLHSLIVAEQMYSACTHLIIGDEYNKRIAKDIPVEFSWKKTIFWDDNISVELIREENGIIGPYKKETGYFTFYSDKYDEVLTRMSASSFWQERSFIKDMNKIIAGKSEFLPALIRKIEAHDIILSKLKNPRTNLKTSKDELISELKTGQISEEKIVDFFSLWD